MRLFLLRMFKFLKHNRKYDYNDDSYYYYGDDGDINGYCNNLSTDIYYLKKKLLNIVKF